MRERPIILQPWEVRAILDGRKQRLTRPVRPQPEEGTDCPYHVGIGAERKARISPFGQPGDRLWGREAFWAKHDTDSDGYTTIDCGPCLGIGPKFHPGIQYVATPPNPAEPNQPGDWWEAPPDDWDGESDYRGKGETVFLPWAPYSKQSPILLPRWASRILLEVTEVRVQRVQEITEEEALAEGAFWTDYGRACHHGVAPCSEPDAFHPCLPGWSVRETTSHAHCLGTARMAVANAWNAKHGADAWDRNEWVWVAEVKRLEVDCEEA